MDLVSRGTSRGKTMCGLDTTEAQDRTMSGLWASCAPVHTARPEYKLRTRVPEEEPKRTGPAEHN